MQKWIVTLVAVCALWHAPAEAQIAPAVDESFTAYSIGGERDEGYRIVGRLRAFTPTGAIPRESVLRFEVRRGEERLSGARCRSYVGPLSGPPETPLTMITATDCEDREAIIRGAGELTIVWWFVDGVTDAERELATHRVIVREVPVYDRGLPPHPISPRVVLDRHSEVLSAFIVEAVYEGGVGFAGFFPRFTATSRRDNHVYLVFNASPSESAGLQSASVRCRLDGQPVELANSRVLRSETLDETTSASMPVEGATTSADSIRPEYVRFHRYSVLLPLTVETPGANLRVGTPLRSGTWECDLRDDTAVTLRTFRFVVGMDGRVAPHAEETEGGLSLGPGIHLVDTVIPGDHPLDARTDPTALARAFYGRGFRSAAGRALSVAPIGDPLPAVPAARPRGSATRTRRR